MEKNEKIDKFLKEYGELVKKHGVDFAPWPQLIPDHDGCFKITVQNIPIDLSERAKEIEKGFIVK